LYFPVVCFILLLAIKHRGLTVFTAANPGIPGGGFVGESKDQIYKLLQGSPSAGCFMLRHRLVMGSLDFTAKIDAANEFIAEKQLPFPIVVKPDKGERGKGVMIVESQTALEDFLSRANDDLILQEYFGGDEASIFYYRLPGETKGRIFSITEKRFPAVAGDGTSDLETLILRNRRAVCMAKSYIQHNSHRLIYVPASGEQIKLIDIGTHSRGAVFLDGAWMKTAELENRIDLMCREIDGFFFGRFDIRARSFADLQRGENFRIIELNGVTSESTNIYDPRHNLFDAYRILFAQWRLAFTIGRENINLGAEPSSVAFLLKSWFESRSGPFASFVLSRCRRCVRNPLNAKNTKVFAKQKRCA
ncbi:MAG TPA: hypothetical protein VLI65_10705, partial [Pyrinomonadaceae bacterium]|nr:hypothetical protein [Pyrinomonadaceae bacterium]